MESLSAGRTSTDGSSASTGANNTEAKAKENTDEPIRPKSLLKIIIYHEIREIIYIIQAANRIRSSQKKGEIYALISESIEIWGFYVRKPLGLPFGLTIRPDGAPTHVIYIEIENIGSRGVVCFSADGRC